MHCANPIKQTIIGKWTFYISIWLITRCSFWAAVFLRSRCSSVEYASGFLWLWWKQKSALMHVRVVSQLRVGGLLNLVKSVKQRALEHLGSNRGHAVIGHTLQTDIWYLSDNFYRLNSIQIQISVFSRVLYSSHQVVVGSVFKKNKKKPARITVVSFIIPLPVRAETHGVALLWETSQVSKANWNETAFWCVQITSIRKQMDFSNWLMI